MDHRSWLIVPGNSEEQLGSAVGTGADAVIVDLENSVPRVFKPAARQFAAEWLKAHRQNVLGRRMGQWVRINGMDSEGMWREDLLSVMPFAPDGIILPKVESPQAVQQLAAELYELEQRHRLHSHSTKIIPLIGETPKSAMRIGEFIDSGHQRLVGLAWCADDLAASISATRKTDEAGHWTDAFRLVRAQLLLAAHACGLSAIESAHGEIHNREALAKAAKDARADGFSGMLALHPDQVDVINHAFVPSEDELREARDIVDAFDMQPEAGVLQYKGRMLDRPQLKMAQRVLDLEHGAHKQQLRTGPTLRPA